MTTYQHTDPTLTIDTSKEQPEQVDDTNSITSLTLQHRLWRPIPITLILATAVCFIYSAYQRFGTTANANIIEITQNIGGGFFALGRTEDQPGFVVLSEIDQDHAIVNANQSVNVLAGTHTLVTIELEGKQWNQRLRTPIVILIDKNAHVEYFPIDWTLEDFSEMQHAVDCSHAEAVIKKRCGAPFTDFHEAITKRGPTFAPPPLRAFLMPYADRREKSDTP